MEVVQFFLDGFSGVAQLLPNVGTNDVDLQTAVYEQLKM